GFILDGYPRNLAQADALDALMERIGQPMDAAVQLEVPTEMLVERIAGRSAAEGRADDSPESVRTRLQVYNDQTAPVVDFFRQRAKLSVVDGVGSLDDVSARSVGALRPVPAVGRPPPPAEAPHSRERRYLHGRRCRAGARARARRRG